MKLERSLLRAVQIHAALLMQTEAECKRAESEGAELNTGVGFWMGSTQRNEYGCKDPSQSQ